MKKFNEMNREELIDAINKLEARKAKAESIEDYVKKVNKIGQLSHEIYVAQQWLAGTEE